MRLRQRLVMVFLMLLPFAAAGQLTIERVTDLGAAAGAMNGESEPALGDWTNPDRISTALLSSVKLLEKDSPAVGLELKASTFDFTKTAPHLAFFCRLEINESAGNVIPVKFRLGGHRYWQDDLLRH